ncbi:MAG TPA: HAMP domain-containing sensor histidine kinase [Gemmatimonadaceae bacterium]|nr:HAMP domain-containing sensor histidine kinase [Gemmatimonadaceae bacterium]
MTLRARLAVGMLGMGIVLLIPLLLAINALRTAEESARELGDAEFAASLLMGRVRKGLEDIRAAENALLFVHDEPSRERMMRELDRLGAMADTLNNFGLAQASELRIGTDSLRTAAEDEYQAARAGNVTQAERISAGTVLPQLEALQRAVRDAEEVLRDRTQARVAGAADATDDAQRYAVIALLLAALTAIGIGAWLMRSISRPVEELERGMASVAAGDFEHRLPFSAGRKDEFGRLAASYESMALQLSDLDRLKAEFISVASHELKTPINVITGYVELLREGIYGELSRKQREVCETIQKQAQTLTRLVAQLLDVSRFEAGGGRIEPKPVSLRKFIKNLENTFRVLALQREIDFDIDCSDRLSGEVFWDEDRMNEVVGNLLSNAFKFTEKGGRVLLEAEPVDDSVRIRVSDTGVGIPPQQLQHVFHKFYQADNQASTPTAGTGLGLAIAKQIVEAHRGTITVESRQNAGTTFTIVVPVSLEGGRSSRSRASDLGLLR